MLPAIIAFQEAAYGRIAPLLGSTPIPLEWDYATILRECEVWYEGACEAPSGLLILRLRAGDLYVESIAVSQGAAGTGLARRMMDFTFARARLFRRSHVRLLTNARNPATGLYEKLGFRLEKQTHLADRTIMHFVFALQAHRRRRTTRTGEDTWLDGSRDASPL